MIRLISSAFLTATLLRISEYHFRVNPSHFIPNLSLLKEKMMRKMTGTHINK
jgi:hypothetical protein